MTTRRIARIALVLLALGLPAAGAGPQGQRGKISAVKATGSQKFPEAQIAAASGLRAGDSITRDDIQAAADRLAQLGVFRNVRFRFASRGESVEIEFQLEDAPTVPVFFDNFPWFSDAELTAALQQSVAFFDGTAPEEGEILEAMRAALEKLLAARGIAARVEHTLLVRAEGEGQMQQFRAVGAAVKIGAVQFQHPLAAENKRVRDRLSDLIGKPYSRLAVEIFLREQVRPVYHEHGHLQAHFGAPAVKLVEEANRPPESVEVSVPIEPGRVYRWGGAQWNATTSFGPLALEAFLGLALNEVANGMKIAGGWERVRAEYASRGHLDATVEAVPNFDDTQGRVSYRVTLTEGPQYRMGKLVVTGLSVAAERRLRAAWRIAPGDVFDEVYFEEFLANIVKPAFGDLPVHYEQIGRWLEKNGETKTVDVLLDFK